MPAARALLSVSDKTGIVEFARTLVKAGYEIVSTGGTMKELQKDGIKALSIEDVTGFPECFGGRVKTIHPLILGGILFNRDLKEDREQAKKLGIVPIDIVVVNLYPFEEKLRAVGDELWAMSKDVLRSSKLIEMIDIGGSTLLRSAAKNSAHVTVVCDTADYALVGSQLQKNGDTTLELRQELAAKVFLQTAKYDALIAGYLSDGEQTGLFLTNGRQLRYGENPHQWGKFYLLEPLQNSDSTKGKAKRARRAKRRRDEAACIFQRFLLMRPGTSDSSVQVSRLRLRATPRQASLKSQVSDRWVQLQGKDLSYLNILDSDAAWRMACDFPKPTAVFVKHCNPSGVASNDLIEDAFQLAYDTDRVSAFGVIIALNRPCTRLIAKKIIDQKIFVEVILAPGFEKKALEVLHEKPNIRLLDMDSVALSRDMVYRSAFGGMLVQNDDTREITAKDLTCVTRKKPTKDQIRDLLFAWRVVKHAKSNAIVLANNRVTVGIGAGQTSRVDSSWIAARRAGERAKGSVLASDAFFPFPDALEEAAKNGITAVIQPGGSIRDREVIACADKLGIAMVITGVRGFRH